MDVLTKKVLTGDIVSAAKLITRIENNKEDAVKIIKKIFPHTGKTYLIGVTGSPGAGKSTLVSELIGICREKELTVGVIAVDASSPFTGGAVLGDRIRMQKNEGDGVFVRSMATRGNLGGLSKATRDAVYVMDAMGLDVIIIETVGVGQVELEIARMAYTTIVVMAPGMGDSIQAMKAGIMEIGDIFVVNKADRDGVDETTKDINSMLRFASGKDAWRPEIFKTIATKSEGISELIGGIKRHKEYLTTRGLLKKKAYDKEQLLSLVKDIVEARIFNNKNGEKYFDEYVQKIINREIDPYTASEIIFEKIDL